MGLYDPESDTTVRSEVTLPRRSVVPHLGVIPPETNMNREPEPGHFRLYYFFREEDLPRSRKTSGSV